MRLLAILFVTACSPVPHAPGCVDFGYGLPDPTAVPEDLVESSDAQAPLEEEPDAGS